MCIYKEENVWERERKYFLDGYLSLFLLEDC
jgi:hypothetical protein